VYPSSLPVLQRVVVSCSVLQCVIVRWIVSERKESLVHLIVTSCVAVSCSELQSVAVCCSALQCVAVCCSVLQCATVCCSALQYVAVCFSVLQCVAVCCSMLQRVEDCQSRRHHQCVPVLRSKQKHIYGICMNRTILYDDGKHLYHLSCRCVCVCGCGDVRESACVFVCFCVGGG